MYSGSTSRRRPPFELKMQVLMHTQVEKEKSSSTATAAVGVLLQ
jgi:hypothetical protein